MTHTSSKGLLPQLVEVLQALADSQELLMHKVRDVRLENMGVHSAAPESPGSEASPGRKPARAHTPARVVWNPAPPHERTELFSSRNTEATQLGAEADSILVHRVVESPIVNDLPDVATSLEASRATRAPVEGVQNALHKMRLQQPSGSETTRQSVADALNAKRDYNFFDELDIRLGDLSSSDTNANGNGASAEARDPKEH